MDAEGVPDRADDDANVLLLVDGLLDPGSDSQEEDDGDAAMQLVPAQPVAISEEELQALIGGLVPAAASAAPAFVPKAQGDPRDRFGPRATVSGIGDDFQQQLFGRYCSSHASAAAGRGPAVRKAFTTVAEFCVRSSKHRSMSAIADQSGVAQTTLLRTLCQFAAALLHAACWLVGTMLVICASWFRRRRMRAVLAVSKFRYDETPLRMKLGELKAFLSVAPGSVLTLPGEAAAESYKYAKILRIDWSVGDLSEVGPTA